MLSGRLQLKGPVFLRSTDFALPPFVGQQGRAGHATPRRRNLDGANGPVTRGSREKPWAELIPGAIAGSPVVGRAAAAARACADQMSVTASQAQKTGAPRHNAKQGTLTKSPAILPAYW